MLNLRQMKNVAIFILYLKQEDNNMNNFRLYDLAQHYIYKWERIIKKEEKNCNICCEVDKIKNKLISKGYAEKDLQKLIASVEMRADYLNTLLQDRLLKFGIQLGIEVGQGLFDNEIEMIHTDEYRLDICEDDIEEY